jgi:proteasome lid subunit RPN8/RPN11
MTRSQWDDLIAHAREDEPNECCGYLSASGGVVKDIVRAPNERNSPYGYELGFQALMAANELEDQGLEVGIYHSHPRSQAEPSQTDINLAHYPTWVYLIVSLVGREDGGEPHIRAWRIAEGKVEEEEIVVE